MYTAVANRAASDLAGMYYLAPWVRQTRRAPSRYARVYGLTDNGHLGW